MAAEAYSIGGALRFAGRTLGANWRAIWGVLALNALAQTVYFAGDLSRMPAIFLAGVAGMIVTTMMMTGAILRLALADRHAGDEGFKPGPMGLQWRALETRVFGANLLAGLFVGFIAFLVLIALMAIGMAALKARGVDPATLATPEALTSAFTTQFTAVAQLAPLLVFAVISFLSVRLLLVGPATADRGRLQVLRTWRATRGQFWRLFVPLLVIQIPVILGFMAVAGVAAPGGAGGPPGPGAAFAIALVVGVLSGAIAAPMQAAIAAYAYRCFGDRIPDGR